MYSTDLKLNIYTQMQTSIHATCKPTCVNRSTQRIEIVKKSTHTHAHKSKKKKENAHTNTNVGQMKKKTKYERIRSTLT